MPRREISEIISALKRDSSIWASASCGHDYRLAESELFYRDELPPLAVDYRRMFEESLTALRQEVKELKKSLTVGFTKKSVEIKLGKTVEKICYVLPGFPYNPFDCRALFDPIDYIVFIGASGDSVTRIDFAELKTGQSALKKSQREIRDAVTDGRVQIKGVNK